MPSVVFLHTEYRIKKEISMSVSTKPPAPINNRLLSALPKNEYQRLFPDLEQINLNYGENIYLSGEQISHVYFPISGIVSLISIVDERTRLEVGLVGNEGMVGLPSYLGVTRSNNRAVVQGEGIGWKMKASDLQKECEYDGELPRLLKLYTYLLLTQTSHAAVCNLYHPVEMRLARWLLMSHDRMMTDEFKLTQEFLSTMLGVRREAVSKSAARLQQKQLIRYSRGNIKINDRKELEDIACSCYAIINKEEREFLG
jgi:CRP-like cAMP-binding protein